MIRREFTGMLPAAIAQFEALLSDVAGLNPKVEQGYTSTAGADSFFHWGAACRISCDDMAALKTAAESLGVTWLSDAGDMAYTNGLNINDFKTFRVNGDLVLTPEEEA